MKEIKARLAKYLKDANPSQIILLSDFIGITEGSILRWKNERSEPSGITLLKIHYFLEMWEDDLIAVQSKNGIIGNIIEAFALGIITEEMASKIIKPSGGGLSRFCKYCWEGKIPKDKIETFRAILNDNNQRIASACEKLVMLIFEVKSKIGHNTCLSRTIVQSTPDIKLFVGLCVSITEVGNEFLAGSAELRHQMRKEMLVGGEPRLHKAWEVLNALLNEKITQKPITVPVTDSKK